MHLRLVDLLVVFQKECSMKIGIVTLPLNINYGGILQAYALQTVLEKLGHEVVVFQKNKYRDNTSVITILKRLFSKYVLRNNVHVFLERDSQKCFAEVTKNIWPFVEHNINIQKVYNYSDIFGGTEFDAIIVGSDQIWRKNYLIKNNIKLEDAYLEFTDRLNVKRISYAASFGLNYLEGYSEHEIEKCSSLLQRFNGVSVREKSGVDICNSFFSVESCWVLDPTLLLDVDDYRHLLKHESSVHKGILCYILDFSNKNSEIIEHISDVKQLHTFYVNDNSSFNSIQPSVDFWIQGFEDADFVITDSFHACVFSIIFRKPFVVLTNAKRGNERIQSLLSMFGLQDRILDTSAITNDEIQKIIEKDIDFTLIEDLISYKKKESINFIKEYLD